MKGILPLWKPKGLTSHDCVKEIRQLFQMRRVGHTGTLDPDVEGVLVICLGQATRVVPYLTEMKKSYIAQCTLGIATETEDAAGEIIEKKEITSSPSKQEVTDALQSFKGDITQIPPMYSAVRVKGKRLYEYARDNEQVDRPKRQVTIHSIKLVEENLQENTFEINVVCSAGTYIRTLCVDIGKKLGFPAHMSALVRTESSGFSAEETVSFSQIKKAKQAQNIHKLLHPIERGLRHLDCLHVNEHVKMKVQHGQKLKIPEKQLKTDPFLVMHENQLLGIYQIHPNNHQEIKPVRIFH